MSCCSKPTKNDDNQKSQGGCCSPKREEQPSSSSSCCSAPRKEEQSPSSSCCSAPKKNQTVISKDMTIESILSLFPNKAQKLSQEITNAGLHCVGCHAAVWETLEGGMKGHGKTDEQISKLVLRLNALLEEQVDLSTISITAKGAEKFLEILAEENKQGWGMRYSEEMAGCSGFEYVLDFSEKADDQDQTFTSNGIDIHVKKAMVPRLLGSEIDYVDGLRGAGFKISNPNAKSACGCGNSHNY